MKAQSELSKEKQKRLLIEMMKEDEKNGMYEKKSDNELIAEFMGARLDATIGNGRWIYAKQPTSYYREDVELRYDSDWNWLMLVVQKVRELSIAVEISYSLGTVCKICYKNGKSFEWLSIEDNDGFSAVYKAVVEFIKWFNSQKK